MGKISKFKRNNKEKKGKLQDLFGEDVCLLDKVMDALSNSLNAFCEEDAEGKKKYADQVIKIEDAQDQIRDEIIARIFGTESMVFSRPDRMRMVTAMDRIVGQGKKVAHDLMVYNPDPVLRELAIHLAAIGKQIAKMGTMTKVMMDQFFDDFDKAIETCIKINEARHVVRDRKSEFFTTLYQIKPVYYDFRFYAELMNNLTEVANRMEHFADFIYGLIAKYSTF